MSEFSNSVAHENLSARLDAHAQAIRDIAEFNATGDVTQEHQDRQVELTHFEQEPLPEGDEE